MSLRFDLLMNEPDASRLNALQLAYLGDSVWELIVRYDLILRRYTVHHMHSSCVSAVNANAQARILNSIQDSLSDAEAEIVRRGRNAHAKHAAPRNQSPEDYAASTGFEALLGYLYLTGQDRRIREIISLIGEVRENV